MVWARGVVGGWGGGWGAFSTFLTASGGGGVVRYGGAGPAQARGPWSPWAAGQGRQWWRDTLYVARAALAPGPSRAALTRAR